MSEQQLTGYPSIDKPWRQYYYTVPICGTSVLQNLIISYFREK